MIDNNIIFYILSLIILIILLNKKEHYLDIKKRYDIEGISNLSSLLKEDTLNLPNLKLTCKVKGNLTVQKINGDIKVDSLASMKRLRMGRTEFNYNYTGQNWINSFPHDNNGFTVRNHNNNCGDIYLAEADKRVMRGRSNC